MATKKKSTRGPVTVEDALDRIDGNLGGIYLTLGEVVDAINNQAKRDPERSLVRNFFHTWRTAEGGERVIEWQGCIVAQPKPELCLVQLFSWVDGAPTERRLVALDKMLDWTFYANGEQMAEAYGKHEAARRAKKGEPKP
jgi:hypothetical protein